MEYFHSYQRKCRLWGASSEGNEVAEPTFTWLPLRDLKLSLKL